MKTKRFTEEQIACALALKSTGHTIAEICRQLSASEQSLLSVKMEVRIDGRGGGPRAEAA